MRAGGVSGWPHSESVAVPAPYIEALHRAGASEAVLLPVSGREVSPVLERADGLLLIGGGDVDPAIYFRERHPRTYGVDPHRDDFEIGLVREAIAREIPVFAVCRGIQVLNVALGGTLHQHLDEGSISHGGVDSEIWAFHDVTFTQDSLLEKAVGAPSASCASHHHQAVADPGEGLLVTAHSPDGLVEGLELERGWVVGVQWHPERTAADDANQQALFSAFVDEARRNLDQMSR